MNKPLPPGRHEAKSCTMATNICGSSMWSLFIVTLLAPSIFGCPLEFLHIFAPLNEIIFYRRLGLVSFVSSESACRMSGEITSAICEMLNLLQEKQNPSWLVAGRRVFISTWKTFLPLKVYTVENRQLRRPRHTHINTQC